MIIKEHPRLSLLKELQTVLNRSGIYPYSLSVSAEAGKDESRTGPGSDRQSVVGKVLIYMEEHLTEPLSLEQLAAEVQVSKYQLIRRFKDKTGSTPWKYLIDKRIHKARTLLENGISPGQVAVEAGFYDQSHLNKIFREETGLTPKEYQERNFRNRN